ncbi:unnamed protein product [Cuscuta epithymum]|uniref:HTH La-type RNA-binding domain-containing protein n=1 Tax=Cuscuta epithymum TaxID=186058 RepID=A0AAV0D1W5_9ASTE|nr:unnamed protein product [Cuscuta epithymum]
MATASSPTNPSPGSIAAADISSQVTNCPKPRRSLSARGASSAWTQIVRRSDSEPDPFESASGAILQSPHSHPTASLTPDQSGMSSDSSHSQAAAPTSGNSSSPDAPEGAEGESSGNDNGSGSNAAKKPVWNKPSGAKEEVGVVMGALSWPALSDSTKASARSDMHRAVSDGLLSVSQGTGITSSSSPHNHLHSNNGNASSTPNHAPNRQRSFKRGGGNSSNTVQANGSLFQVQGEVGEMAPQYAEKSGKSSAESSSKDIVNRDDGQRGFGAQSQGGNVSQHPRNSNRRGNGGTRPRGDGSYNPVHGGARDHERTNQEWNHNRGFGGRDAHIPPQRFPSRPFIRGPPTPPPFIPPTMPIRPFSTPIIYPEVASPVFYVPGLHQESFRMPMFPNMPPYSYHAPDPQLYSKIVNQIDYYFSNDNLIKDVFLRENMDEQGWVPIKLIAGFKRVSMLTDSVRAISEALQASGVVEIQDGKVRRRDDWMKWIVPHSMRYSSHQAVLQDPNKVSVMGHLKSVTLDEVASNGSADACDSRGSSSQQQSGNKIISEGGQSALAGNSSYKDMF